MEILPMLSHLDDWVLCQGRHKGNMSKDTCEDQDSWSLELRECLPKIEQVQPTPTKYDAELITDYLNKDWSVGLDTCWSSSAKHSDHFKCKL